MNLKLKKISSLIFILLFVSCIAPHSRFYQPISDWEKNEFINAKREIYPDDVRNNIDMYKDSLVVWPGIIQEYKTIQHNDKIELEFLFEHHYYDWIEDFSIQKAKIFLSPRGEGLFKASWFLNKDAEMGQIESLATPGNMGLVYGVPQELLNDGTIVLKCTYLRGIEKQWYRTDVMDYGRKGEEVKILNVPMH